MENKSILLLRHHPMRLKFDNPFYKEQTENDLSEYMVIDVTSRIASDKAFMAEHPDFAKELSPFFIGPVVSSDGVTAQIFEIFWQCGKVYPCHDSGGQPNAGFFEWRNSFYSQEQCSKELMRHACRSLGYVNRDARYFAYYDSKEGRYLPLNYVEARKKVYFPEYAKLVYNTGSFGFLKSLVDSGQKIALVDFDACNYNEACAMKKQYQAYLNKCKSNGVRLDRTEADFLSIRSMKDLVNCSYLPAGHGCVLKAMLQGDIEVVDGKVVDRAGILV